MLLDIGSCRALVILNRTDHAIQSKSVLVLEDVKQTHCRAENAGCKAPFLDASRLEMENGLITKLCRWTTVRFLNTLRCTPNVRQPGALDTYRSLNISRLVHNISAILIATERRIRLRRDAT